MECPICYEQIKNVITLSCQGKHIICKSCFHKLEEHNKNTCPMCREVLNEIKVKDKSLSALREMINQLIIDISDNLSDIPIDYISILIE